MILFVLSVIVLAVGDVLTQSCENYGTQNGSGCSCLPGFGGVSCNQVACGGTFFSGPSRPLAPVNGSNSNVTGCICEAGWSGTGCNVCTSSGACQAAFDDVRRNQSTSVSPSNFQNTPLVCNIQPRIYAAGEMSCKIIDPTLQALFPSRTDLTILRTLDPSLSPQPGTTSFGSPGSIFAQLFYDGVEQLYCSADSCSRDDTGGRWTCTNLKCTCRPGTTFCGAQPSTNLTQTINTLTGTLTVDCVDGPCLFKQQTLQSLFGPQGLELSDCVFGECVAQSVIDGVAPSAAPSPGLPLNPGVRAAAASGGGIFVGLALAGVILLA